MSKTFRSGEPDSFTYHTSMAVRWGFAVMFIFITGLAFIGVVKLTLVSFAFMGPPGYALLVALFALACATGRFTVRLCLGAARGLPCVTATSTEVRLTTAFGVQWAEWGSLTPFVATRVLAARGSQSAAVSKIVGPGVSPNLNGEREFVITGGQLMRNSIGGLVYEINARRPISKTCAA
jgi:hypothetical protein